MKYIETGWYESASPEERDLFHDWLHGILADQNLSYVSVTFKKKDGTERVMKCTLREDIATRYEKKTERKSNPDTCFVFDTEKQEWRSFRYDSIRVVAFEFGL